MDAREAVAAAAVAHRLAARAVRDVGSSPAT
jgi:hypothetical protein